MYLDVYMYFWLSLSVIMVTVQKSLENGYAQSTLLMLYCFVFHSCWTIRTGFPETHKKEYIKYQNKAFKIISTTIWFEDKRKENQIDSLKAWDLVRCVLQFTLFWSGFGFVLFFSCYTLSMLLKKFIQYFPCFCAAFNSIGCVCVCVC